MAVVAVAVTAAAVGRVVAVPELALRRAPLTSRNQSPEYRSDVSAHILPVSATMVGVCVTVIGIVRVIEANARLALILDNIVAVDSALFLAATVLSYASLRSPQVGRSLERSADLIFLLGLATMVVISFMLAWEIGESPVLLP